MSTAKGYYDAILALSGDPVFAAARDALVASISDEDIMDVVTHIYKNVLPRTRRKRLTTLLLDLVAKAKADEVGAAPMEDAHGGGDGNDDDDSGGGDGSKDSGGSSGHAAQKGEESRPAQAAQKQPAQNPTAKENRSSTSNKKRTGDCLMQDEKKRKNVSPEPMDDEEDLVKREIVNDEEQPEVIIIDDPIGPVNHSAKPSSGSSETVSSASETDSDTDTSLGRDTPWKRAQKLSIMPDLDLEHGDNDDDLDYTEDLADTELPLAPGLRSQTTSVPVVEICFLVPGNKGFERKKLADFPISFVKEVIRKFNGDYMNGLQKRRKYRKMIKEADEKETCVHHQQHPDHGRCICMDGYTSRACYFCVNHKKLCARVERPEGGEVRLAVYPLGLPYGRLAHWSSMAFWVHK